MSSTTKINKFKFHHNSLTKFSVLHSDPNTSFCSRPARNLLGNIKFLPQEKKIWLKSRKTWTQEVFLGGLVIIINSDPRKMTKDSRFFDFMT